MLQIKIPTLVKSQKQATNTEREKDNGVIDYREMTPEKRGEVCIQHNVCNNTVILGYNYNSLLSIG